jgi:SlyX protein
VQVAKGTEMNQRIEELETQLAFQEDTLQTLNEIVTRQQLQIDKLSHDVQVLSEQLLQLSDAMRRPESEEAPPPHY